MKQAFVVPDAQTRLTVRVGSDGVWLTFHGSDGLTWTVNASAFAAQAPEGSLARRALNNWQADMRAAVTPSLPTATDDSVRFDDHG